MRRLRSRTYSSDDSRGYCRWRHVALPLLAVAVLGAQSVGLSQVEEASAVCTDEQRAAVWVDADLDITDRVFPSDPVEPRDWVVQGCASCHGLGLIIYAVDFSEEDWDLEIARHGRRNDLQLLRLSDEQIDEMTAYLKRYFNPCRALPEDIPEWLIGNIEAY